MSEKHVTLTGDEHDYLVHLLKTTLNATRVEEHRTRRPSYREIVVHEEQLLEALLEKLGQPAE